ncbi:MAG: heme-binding domain-containing protein [Bacteriovoracaceae bacterium]|nr:heme-binding domain-containing protein [Bacteriovoracaceae bacterium]
MKIAILISFLFVSSSAFSHGKKHHGAEEKRLEVPEKDISTEIKESYKKEIRPIFVAKCFNCHSSQTNYPWYHKVPVVGRIMDFHIKDGRSHIDMTNDFPFKGHGGPIKDIEAIIKVTERDEMPPWYYSLFTKNSKLTALEKQNVMSWSKSSLAKLKAKKNAGQ